MCGNQNNKYSMNLYYDGYSNVPSWISEADLENTNTLLWHTFHQRYWTYEELVRIPKWHTADRIFLVGQEGNNDVLLNRDSRIHVWDSLVKPGVDKFHSYFWWWWQTVEVNFYQQLTAKLTDPLAVEPRYVFDCIMGDTRPHRTVIYNLLVTHNTKNCCLIKYHNDPWLSGNTVDLAENLKHYNRAVGYNNISGTLFPFNNNQTANISTWLPWKIYNQSWFTIVAETDYRKNFFTEKTAKALLGKKLFVYIGAAGALKDLRHLGFKTFDGIIDESYDLEPNNEKRWAMAFDQIKSVCAQRSEDVYKAALPIIEHNQKIILEFDWRQRAISEMQKIVHGG